MRKYILLGTFLAFASASAQEKKYEWFATPEKPDKVEIAAKADPADPNAALPIDDYLPLLAVAGVAMIFMMARKMRAEQV